MPRKKSRPDSDYSSSPESRSRARLRMEPRPSSVDPKEEVAFHEAPVNGGVRALSYFRSVAGSRYAVNWSLEGTAYHKLSWSLGEWAGHYIMYVANRYETWEDGAAGLLEKLYRVEEGTLKPTLDRWKHSD